MASFAVDTNQLRTQASQLRSVCAQMDQIAIKLGGMQLGSVLRIKASTALIGKIGDCKWAAANQSDDLNRLAQGLESIADVYENCENKLLDPSFQMQTEENAAEVSAFTDWLDAIEDIPYNLTSWFFEMAGSGSPYFAVFSALFEFGKGDIEGTVKGIEDLVGILGDGTKAIFNNEAGKINPDWVNELFGANASDTGNWSDAWKQYVDDMDFGKQTTAAGKFATVCKWAGYAMSFVSSGVENYDEFGGNWSNPHLWGETVIEGAVDIGLGAGASIAASALLPATWPAIAVGAVGAVAVWGVNAVVEGLTGADVGEHVANGAMVVIDGITEGIGNAIDSTCEWIGSLFAPEASAY